MQKNLLEYLEYTVKRFPNKNAFSDETEQLTFKQLHERARAIGTFLLNNGHTRQPVCVFMEKSANTVAAFLGVLYAGCYYVPVDVDMPEQRIGQILSGLDSPAVICGNSRERIFKAEKHGAVYEFDAIIKTSINDKTLNDVRIAQKDTDPVYIVLTSGSTGVPKGVIACHRSVIDYIDNLCEAMGFDSHTVFGNQAPLYVDGHLKDVYSALKTGATACIIPKKLFMFPLRLIEFLNKNKINTICWAASALSLLSAHNAFDSSVPEHLRIIAFGSEVFPAKQLRVFIKYIPKARYFNLYGPTEATGMSCYYEVDREFGDNETIPIGKPFNNSEVILLDEKDRIPRQGELGEICISGSSLTLGYYRDFEKTSRVFVQNPLNRLYPEIIYRTGDLGRYNDRGELIFAGRKDNQIKHMGYRIELSEIEAITGWIDGVSNACCYFDDINKKIILFYTGEAVEKQVIRALRDKLPRYMQPNCVHRLSKIPLTQSGKTDRRLLMESYKNSEDIKYGQTD